MPKRVQAYEDSEGPAHLGFCTVCSEPSLSANRIIGFYRMFQWRAKALMNFEHVQDDVNPHILRTFESIFSLDMANISQNHEKRHIQTCAPSNKLNQRAYPCNRLCCLPEQNLDCWLSKENQSKIDKSV